MGDAASGLNHLQQALQTLRAYIATNPKFANYRRELSNCYDALGHYYTKLAAQSGAPIEQQLSGWREARQWYQQNLAILQEHLKQSPNDSQSHRFAQQASKNVAQCDAALAVLAAKQRR